ncbi:MAG: hypothetical protein LC772_09150 [Chloroflexi bacterium]|nr:hypothetical protein [Chloroflexota bacterium]
MLRHGFTDTRLRRNIATVSAAIYLWSLLFAVFGHNEVFTPSAAPAGSPNTVCRSLRGPIPSEPPCAACAWDQCAGHALITPVFCVARPPAPAALTVRGARAFSCSSPRNSSSRAPPATV